MRRVHFCPREQKFGATEKEKKRKKKEKKTGKKEKEKQRRSYDAQ